MWYDGEELGGNMLRNETTKQERPMFTRRHYEAIAHVIALEHTFVKARPVNRDEAHFTIRRVTASLARMFQRDNPGFTSVKFREACGEVLTRNMPAD